MDRRAVIYLVAGLVCAVGAVLLAKKFLLSEEPVEKPTIVTKKVLVATKDIGYGEKLVLHEEDRKNANARFKDWPKKFVPKKSISSADPIKDKGHFVRESMHAGQPIFEAALVHKEDILPPGVIVEHFDFGPQEIQGIKAGDRVDIAKIQSGWDREPLLKNVRVLSVGKPPAALTDDGGKEYKHRLYLRFPVGLQEKVMQAKNSGKLSVRPLAEKQVLERIEVPLRTFHSPEKRAITALAFAPNGSQLLIGNCDGNARARDPHTGELLYVLSGHGGAVTTVAFSPDGMRVATGSTDKTVKLWGWAKQVTCSGHEGAIYSVAFSPTEAKVVTGSADNTARIWDSQTGEQTRVLKGHSAAVKCVCFSPDGDQICTTSEDKTVKVWDTQSGTEIKTLRGHLGPVLSAAYSPEGKRLLTGSADKVAKIWNIAEATSAVKLGGHEGAISAVAFAPTGARVLTASTDKTAKIWLVPQARAIFTLQAHKKALTCAAFSADGAYVATGGDDGNIMIWNSGTEAYAVRSKKKLKKQEAQEMLADAKEMQEDGALQMALRTFKKVSEQYKQYAPKIAKDAKRSAAECKQKIARHKLSEMQKAFDAGNNSRVIQLHEELKKQFPEQKDLLKESNSLAEKAKKQIEQHKREKAYKELAEDIEKALNKGDVKGVEKLLEKLTEEYSGYKPSAGLMAPEVQKANARHEITSIEQWLKNPKMRLNYYIDDNNKEKALEYYKKMKDKYPEHPVVEEAEEELKKKGWLRK
ncbi:MAG: hypothetical protein ACLFWL_03760 [Candidatus Brocadiia bacterium]